MWEWWSPHMGGGWCGRTDQTNTWLSPWKVPFEWITYAVKPKPQPLPKATQCFWCLNLTKLSVNHMARKIRYACRLSHWTQGFVFRWQECDLLTGGGPTVLTWRQAVQIRPLGQNIGRESGKAKVFKLTGSKDETQETARTGNSKTLRQTKGGRTGVYIHSGESMRHRCNTSGRGQQSHGWETWQDAGKLDKAKVWEIKQETPWTDMIQVAWRDLKPQKVPKQAFAPRVEIF